MWSRGQNAFWGRHSAGLWQRAQLLDQNGERPTRWPVTTRWENSFHTSLKHSPQLAARLSASVSMFHSWVLRSTISVVCSNLYISYCTSNLIGKTLTPNMFFSHSLHSRGDKELEITVFFSRYHSRYIKIVLHSLVLFNLFHIYWNSRQKYWYLYALSSGTQIGIMKSKTRNIKLYIYFISYMYLQYTWRYLQLHNHAFLTLRFLTLLFFLNSKMCRFPVLCLQPECCSASLCFHHCSPVPCPPVCLHASS